MKAKNIRQANAAYENWLRTELGGDVVVADLFEKQKKMSQGPFPFLRATYWRWAETILTVCPNLEEAPEALCVGDIHLENFGTWRDVDGRLVWGVNDFDESAKMPYVLDLVRLAVSARLAQPSPEQTADDICGAILDGYKSGLAHPRPFVLDEEHPWLREMVAVPDKERDGFWRKMDKLKLPEQPPPKQYRKSLGAAMPEPDLELIIRPRRAGTGSLGRPRWIGMAEWRGGRVVREAKALVTSGWNRVMKRASPKLRCKEIAFGIFRAPDPWFDVAGGIGVRRLSPNSRKIEIDESAADLLDARILQAMGHDLASVHLGTGDRRSEIEGHLAAHESHWLQQATKAAAEHVRAEFAEWQRG